MKRLAMIGIAWLGIPAAASAYSSPGRYDQDPLRGGSGGRFFTGSPTDGFTCEVCHAGDAPGPEVTFHGVPDVYDPGETYPISFSWKAHDFGTSTEVVTMVVELQTDDGEPAGTLVLPPAEETSTDAQCTTGVPAAELFELADRRTVATLHPCGAERLRARWTAPTQTEACTPDAVLYVAAMQGDESEDPQGDGLTLRTRRIAPVNACAEEATGCRVGGPGSFLSLLLPIAAIRRRRRNGGAR